MDLGLETSRAFVTAANQGLGFAVAQELVREGAQVAFCGRGSERNEEAAEIMAAVPMGRMANPKELGWVAAFLLSPAASYLNGVMLPVDGGASAGLL